MLTGLRKAIQQEQNEALFIELFRAGDSKAFEQIYQYLKQPLTLFALNIVRSAADAEDIIGTAFLKLYSQGRKKLDSPEHIQRWLNVVVRNECITLLRQRSMQKKARLFYAYRDGLQEENTREDIDQLLDQVIGGLQTLSRQRSTVLRLCFFEQKTTREIAAILRINGQTVLNHKTKGIQFLRCQVVGNARL
jgi:RNA polymerase sigma factor (sigma-70 family)